jgi:hypothetical protein
MPEINARIPTEVAAGRKALFDSQGHTSVAVCEMPLVHAGAAIADTIGFGVILRKGSRLLAGGIILSNSAGTASSTIAVGLRNPVTKVAIDATAIMAQTAITTAATAPVATGTKVNAGQRYVLLEDAELYATAAGAAVAANQAIRIEVPYIAA